MRTLPLVLLAAAALLSPAATLAAGPTAPMPAPGRYFVINGMVLGNQKGEASGKLSVEGGRLMASVGCNTIGGAVALNGDTLTITEPLSMTAMGCLGAVADAEAMFIKVLQRGPFVITSTAWTGDGGALFTTELASGPGPNASGPADEPVGSSPGPVVVDPNPSCPPLPSGSDGGNGSTGSGSGAIDGGIVPPDAGGGTGGSSGSGGGTTPGGSGSSGGSAPSSTAVANPGTTTTAPAPPDPAGTPAPDESPTLGQTEPEPSINGKPVPSDVVIVGPGMPAPSAVSLPGAGTGGDPGTVDPGTGVEPGSSVDIDPGFNGKPIPGDPCERAYAVDAGSGAGSAIPPKVADLAAEHAADGVSNASSMSLPLSAGLLGLFVIGAIGARRWWMTAHPVVAPGESGPPGE